MHPHYPKPDNLDDPGYFWSSTPAIDEYGRYLPDPYKFESSSYAQGTRRYSAYEYSTIHQGNVPVGFKPLIDDIHELGLKFGVHIMRGVPRWAVDSDLYQRTEEGDGDEYYNNMHELSKTYYTEYPAESKNIYVYGTNNVHLSEIAELTEDSRSMYIAEQRHINDCLWCSTNFGFKTTYPNGIIEYPAYDGKEDADTLPICATLDPDSTLQAAMQAYYDSMIDLYVYWGVDYFKADDFNWPAHAEEIEMLYNAVAKAIRRYKKPVVISLSPGPWLAAPWKRDDTEDKYAKFNRQYRQKEFERDWEHAAAHTQMWRINSDI